MKNYVVIPGTRMAGLFSYVMQVLHNLSVVDKTGDKLYVKYDHSMLYIDPTSTNKNVWDYYFHQPFTFTRDEVLINGKEKVIFIEDSRAIPFAFTTRLTPDMISTGRDLVNKYIRIKSNITEKVDDFVKENFGKNKYFAIHKRGTDHYKDAPLLPIEEYFRKTDKLLESYQSGVVCTDEVSTVKLYKDRYGDRIKFYDSIRSNTNEGIHYSVGLNSPYKMGEDVLVESLIMSKSNHLVKTVSGVTTFSILYGELFYEDIDLHVSYTT